MTNDPDSRIGKDHPPEASESGAAPAQDRAGAELAGSAALSLVEAMILALVEKKIIEPHDVDEMFYDAIAAHEQHAENGESPQFNKAVASLLRRLHSEGNSVRLHQD